MTQTVVWTVKSATIFVIHAACAAMLFGQAPAPADVQSPELLLVVHRPTELREASDFKRTQRTDRRILAADTVVIGLRQESLDDGAVHGWQVATYDKPARRGWIPSSAITEFGQRVSELQATAVSLQAERLPASEIDTLPELILRQQNREIQTAWREIAIAVEENQKLPESERLPEPYFARAEIWAAVDNYSDSLQDYLTAIRYARQSGRDLLSYSDYFQRMYNVAEELEKMPVSAAGAESNAAAAAVKHYGAGLHRYFAGDIPAALAHFDNAVQLSPNKAIYWYLRGLTHRRVGDHARAQYDVLMGAAFEKTLPSWKQRALNGQLIRIQGESRQWLEAFRLGAAKNQLPNSPLIDASISRANP